MSTNAPMTQEQLDAIQERVDAATPGPWAVDSDDPAYIIYPEKGGWDGLVIAHVAEQDGALFPVEHNGALIAHAREDIPALLAEVERLRAQPAVTEDMVERAARASYGPVAWDRLLEAGGDPTSITAAQLSIHRAMVRAVLAAALDTQEEE